MDKELSRRRFLEWLGKGSVVALSMFMVGSCDTNGTEDIPSRNPESMKTGSSGDFPFTPINTIGGPTWPDRTVDRQELEDVINNWNLKIVTPDNRYNKVYTFTELVNLPRSNMNVDFHCVEGWSLHDIPWNGVHLSTIFEDMGITPNYSHVTFRTIGGTYNESLPLDVALEEKTLLAYGIGGYTMPLERGFPLRLVVPKLLAYKSAKYVETIKLTNEPINGFWEDRGYPYEAPVLGDRLRKGKY
jgi:DMSO/TMAO reductase YedYZ molybdopterin-dependent catalytic subunit